jgi:CRP-like cAMP-binding protein
MSRNTLQCLLSNDWNLIGASAKRVSFTLGDVIIHQVVQISDIFVIRKGSASVEMATAYSNVVLALLQEGDVCGEMGFLERNVAAANVVAKDVHVEADAIPAEEVHKVLNTYPGLAGFYESLALILAQRLRDTSGELVRSINTIESWGRRA